MPPGCFVVVQVVLHQALGCVVVQIRELVDQLEGVGLLVDLLLLLVLELSIQQLDHCVQIPLVLNQQALSLVVVNQRELVVHLQHVRLLQVSSLSFAFLLQRCLPLSFLELSDE